MSETLGTASVPPGPVRGTRGFARAGVILAAASLGANLFGYGFAVVLSRALGPGEYGALAALIALGLIGSIPAIALQLVVARELASTRAGAQGWVRTSLVIGGALLLSFWALAPAAEVYLELASPFAVMWIGVALLPTTAAGALQGILLGRQQYGGLAASYLLLAGLRFAGGCVAAATGSSVSGALAAAAGGTLLAWPLVAAITARGAPHKEEPTDVEGLGVRWRLQALTAAASATAAVLVLTNLDVVMARHFLAPGQSGLYGVGALFAKASFWAPHFLAVLVFPLLANRESRRRSFVISLSLTLAIGGVVVAAAMSLAAPIIEVTVGSAYDDAAALAGRFAALGVLAAIVQLLLFSGLARRTRRVELIVWIGIGAQVLIVSVWFHESAQQIVNASILVCAVLSVTVAAVELRSTAHA